MAWSWLATTAVEGVPPIKLTKDVETAMVMAVSTKGLGVTRIGTSGVKELLSVTETV